MFGHSLYHIFIRCYFSGSFMLSSNIEVIVRTELSGFPGRVTGGLSSGSLLRLRVRLKARD